MRLGDIITKHLEGAQKKGLIMTAAQLAEGHRDKIEYLAKVGTSKGLKEHPEWEAQLLPDGTKRQTLYTAVSNFRSKGHRTTTPKPPKPAQTPGRKPRGSAVSDEQRDNIIRFLKSDAAVTKYPSRTQLLQAAFDLYAPGAVTVYGSTVKRWFGYIGKKGIDPDLTPSKATPQPEANGARTTLGRPKGSTYMKKDQKEKFVNWLAANRSRFETNTQAFEAALKEFGFTMGSASATVQKYINLAKAAEKNGHAAALAQTVHLLNRDFTIAELETIIRGQAEAMRPLKHCPECGYNLAMHTKSYSIAIRHSNQE